MTEKELRKLNRKDLLQMLIDQSQEVEVLQTKLDEAHSALRKLLSISPTAEEGSIEKHEEER